MGIKINRIKELHNQGYDPKVIQSMLAEEGLNLTTNYINVTISRLKSKALEINNPDKKTGMELFFDKDIRKDEGSYQDKQEEIKAIEERIIRLKTEMIELKKEIERKKKARDLYMGEKLEIKRKEPEIPEPIKVEDLAGGSENAQGTNITN
jgi:hypothetical protein